MLEIGLDLGFGAAKAVASDGRAVEFPAYVARASALTFGDAQGADVLRDEDGQAWAVGEDALRESASARRSFSSDKAAEAGERIKARAALAQLLGTQTNADIPLLVSGLPVSEMNTQGDALRRMLSGTHRFTWRGRNYAVNVRAVRLVPQGGGVFFAASLRSDASAVTQSRLAGRVLVADIGYRTANLVTVDGGKFVAASSRSVDDGGVSILHNDLRQRIAAQHGFDPGAALIDTACRTKRLEYDGREWPIRGLISEAAEAFCGGLIDAINVSADPRRASAVLLGGGGSAFEEIREAFSRRFGDRLIVSEASTLANARGFAEFAALTQRTALG